MNWEYQTHQFRTVPTVGVWSKLAEEDIQKLDRLLNAGWEVHQIVNIRGSVGFTAHVVFILRRLQE